ncbi:hypothetical protein N9E59_02850 [Polaribacter sp.]|jgi:hypothetical protein|nr:hypothetical protein [Polaribacter sp.]MDA9333646.1 hypothetical protein [Polaribacter sp.]MDA9976881.1 hypothetical protein [Polaribacter sp.]MDB4167997.1 hypothetical protein [Polaribacter sp.]MDB4201725.1 hypothetical protein [Polaribacter sp.]
MKVFKEEQRFRQVWLMVLLGFSLLVPVGLIIKEYIKDNTSMTTNEFLGSLIGIIASVLLIFIFKLSTRIDEKGIHYQFFPFHFSMKTLLWSEITKAEIRTYDPIGEYGGWGLRYSFNKKKGNAVNVSGDIGIQLTLKNGKKLLIGTQKKEAVSSVLKTYNLIQS